MLYSQTMETDFWRIWLDCFFLPSRASKLDDAELESNEKELSVCRISTSLRREELILDLYLKRLEALNSGQDFACQ
jgi:hypothetical protein